MDMYYHKDNSRNPYHYHSSASLSNSIMNDIYPGVHAHQPYAKGYKNRSEYRHARKPSLSTGRSSISRQNDSSSDLDKITKYLRFFVVLICVGTFFYYVTEFFHTFQSYPTVVDVSVEFKDNPDLPAITICNHNLYRRAEFCASLSELSLNVPDFTLLCRKHHATHTNYVNHSDIVRMFTRLVSAKVVSRLAHNETRFFKKCKIKTVWGNDRPFTPCQNSLFFNVNGRNCFVVNSMWFEYQPDYEKKNDSELEIEINLETNEYLIDPAKPAAEVYIHSRTAIPDGRTSHFAAKGGFQYSVGIIKTSLHLLEPPYETGCLNYTREFEKSGGKHTNAARGQLSQQDTALGKSVCRKLCQIKEVKRQFDCVPYCLPFSDQMKKCQGNKTAQNQKCVFVKKKKEFCDQKCPVECKITEDRNLTKITINLQLIRHSIFSHKPKITSVEILGYVGGYLGIFLGISIPMLFDSCMSIIGFLHRQYHKRKSVSQVRQRPNLHHY